MGSSCFVCVQAVCLLLLVTTPTWVSGEAKKDTITHHGGPLLTGQVNLSILFYGKFMKQQRKLLRRFLKSLNDNQSAVSKWWDIVENYVDVAGADAKNKKSVDGARKIKIKVGTQQSDDKCSLGKVLTHDFIKSLVDKCKTGSKGKANTIAVIFTAPDVTVTGLCRGQCSEHGEIGRHPYLIVGNPEIECPGVCGVPFVKADYGPAGPILKPPNQNMGIDALLFNFASGLAATVTNPFGNGFFKEGPKKHPLEASTACPPANYGNIQNDPKTGGAYNAVGQKGSKFLLPPIWNPKTSSCWTPA